MSLIAFFNLLSVSSTEIPQHKHSCKYKILWGVLFGLIVVAFVLLVSLSFGGGMFVDFCLFGFLSDAEVEEKRARCFFMTALQSLVKISYSRQKI